MFNKIRRIANYLSAKYHKQVSSIKIVITIPIHDLDPYYPKGTVSLYAIHNDNTESEYWQGDVTDRFDLAHYVSACLATSKPDK